MGILQKPMIQKVLKQSNIQRSFYIAIIDHREDDFLCGLVSVLFIVFSHFVQIQLQSFHQQHYDLFHAEGWQMQMTCDP